jgi:hypothetical protein
MLVPKAFGAFCYADDPASSRLPPLGCRAARKFVAIARVRPALRKRSALWSAEIAILIDIVPGDLMLDATIEKS